MSKEEDIDYEKLYNKYKSKYLLLTVIMIHIKLCN